MENENTLIDIIDDQAHAIQKLCLLLKEEKTKKHVVLENCKIIGDSFIVNGNVDTFGTLDLTELKKPFEVKGELNCKSSTILFTEKKSTVKKIKKVKK